MILLQQKQMQEILKSRNQVNKKQQPQQKLYSKVSRTQNYKYYCFTFCKISNIRNYAIVQLLLLFGIVTYSVVCAPYCQIGIAVLSGIFYLLTILFLICLAFIDPGIIPKFLQNYQNPDFVHIPADPRYFNDQMSQDRWSYPIVQKNFLPSLRFCQQCCIYKPPRTIHCYSCNACMKKLDHHCPWIGTCIAKNNYKYFILFITCLSIFLGLVLGQTIYAVYKFSLQPNVVLIVFNSILILLSFLGFGFSSTLLFYHIYLINSQLTTNQFCKQMWVRTGNPYQKSNCFKNLLKIFNSPKIVLSDPEACLIKRLKKPTKQIQIEKVDNNNINKKKSDQTRQIIKNQQINFQVQLEENFQLDVKNITSTQQNLVELQKKQHSTPQQANKIVSMQSTENKTNNNQSQKDKN